MEINKKGKIFFILLFLIILIKNEFLQQEEIDLLGCMKLLLDIEQIGNSDRNMLKQIYDGMNEKEVYKLDTIKKQEKQIYDPGYE